MSLLCRIGFHAWEITEGLTLYSKGGILMPTVTLGERRCTRCPQTRPLFRMSTLFGGPAKWRALTAEFKAAIDQGYLEFNALRPWREARDEAKIKEFEGTACRCGGTWVRAEHDQTWKTWVGLECTTRQRASWECSAPTPACYLREKPIKAKP